MDRWRTVGLSELLDWKQLPALAGNKVYEDGDMEQNVDLAA